jgi:hypothetical protein
MFTGASWMLSAGLMPCSFKVHCSPLHSKVFQVVSSCQISWPKFCVHFSAPTHDVCPAHLILCNLINIWQGVPRGFLLCNSVHLPITFYLLGSNILLSMLHSNMFFLYHISHPVKNVQYCHMSGVPWQIINGLEIWESSLLENYARWNCRQLWHDNYNTS